MKGECSCPRPVKSTLINKLKPIYQYNIACGSWLWSLIISEKVTSLRFPDGRAFLIGYNAIRGTLTGELTMSLDILFSG